MTKEREASARSALELARDLLKKLDKDLVIETWQLAKTLGAIDAALAQPAVASEQEPCRHRIADIRNEAIKSGYMCMDCGALFGAYTTPPPVPEAHKRKPLTDEQMQFLATAIGQAQQIIDTHNAEFVTARDDLRRCAELLAAHGIKENT